MKNFRKNLKIKLPVYIILGIIVLSFFLYEFEVIPHPSFDNAYFHITTYQSQVDQDNDDVDDQTDILQNAKAYLSTKPKYKSKYYSTGYSDDEYGVCTDVVVFALLNAGYDIKNLLYEDILANQEAYNITNIDKNIDFRRVKNLQVYLARNAISLPTDFSDLNAWQGGDIVVFERHIGIVSDKRNYKGIPFLLHHANPYQIRYEEDVLEKYTIVGHYRIS